MKKQAKIDEFLEELTDTETQLTKYQEIIKKADKHKQIESVFEQKMKDFEAHKTKIEKQIEERAKILDNQSIQLKAREQMLVEKENTFKRLKI